MSEPTTTSELLELLSSGTIKLLGQFTWGSNYTFLADVDDGTHSLKAVYKPSQGERPLWDFDYGTLAAREAAAYVVSDSLGWGLVPPTVLRQEGPAGPGSLQLFVNADPERHYFTFTEDEKQRLRPAALFDALINNADRKGGHVLMGGDGHIWLIDHGVCFHPEQKLRTVIWDFAGQPIPHRLLEDVTAFHGRLYSGSDGETLASLLSREEIEALQRRAEWLLAERRFPRPDRERPYPWPLV
jgi:uncharacterized repeat protein (TIGR03843 family)